MAQDRGVAHLDLRMSRSARRWLLAALAALGLALLGYFVAGPYLALNGLRRVVAAGDEGQLWRYVDFARLRESLQPQLQARIVDGLAQRLGKRADAQMLGGVTAVIAAPAVEAFASPAGIAMLLRGSALRPRADAGAAPAGDATGKAPFDPLRTARTRWESPSLFTATVPSAEGKPVVFEFRRSGLEWKLAGIRLPPLD